ncbi:hypothetical protein F2Q69_00019676 [Brassica cretica]|uniref:Uncharacterized protein n=1 Tax=Brassica cretica TaxID=69181 RepID=A0A8S9QM21_BRACR|nr:hypothetical protein F2Q69_00019676 [Brassica cretica]
MMRDLTNNKEKMKNKGRRKSSGGMRADAPETEYSFVLDRKHMVHKEKANQARFTLKKDEISQLPNDLTCQIPSDSLLSTKEAVKTTPSRHLFPVTLVRHIKQQIEIASLLDRCVTSDNKLASGISAAFRICCATLRSTISSFVGLVRHIKQQSKLGRIKRLSAPLVSPFNPTILSQLKSRPSAAITASSPRHEATKRRDVSGLTISRATSHRKRDPTAGPRAYRKDDEGSDEQQRENEEQREEEVLRRPHACGRA